MLKCKILRWILRINNLPRPKVRDLWDNKRADLRGWEASAVEEPQTIWITCQNTPSRSAKYLQSNSKIKTCPQVQIITQKPKWSIQINNQSNCLSLPPARPQRVPTSPLSSLPQPCSQRARGENEKEPSVLMRSLRARHDYTRQCCHIISKNTVQRRGKGAKYGTDENVSQKAQTKLWSSQQGLRLLLWTMLHCQDCSKTRKRRGKQR